MNSFKRVSIIITMGILLLALTGLFKAESKDEGVKAEKLYWFIPDGMRADPSVFQVYEWAQQGLLPNMKYVMDHGVYGYSIPTFPGHTPTNFATLLTGANPSVTGVADGPMHVEGAPLDKPSVKGFASTGRKVPAVWSLMEEANKSVNLLSIPGSTPPELESGVVVEGRWGGWGYENPALIFQSNSTVSQGRGKKLFYLGDELTKSISSGEASNWSYAYESFSPAIEVNFTAYGGIVYGLIVDSSDDNKTDYDGLIVSADKASGVFLREGEWSNWTSVTLNWSGQVYNSSFMAVPIVLGEDSSFRIRVFYDNLNEFMVSPSGVFSLLHAYTGPMVDYVDNFPPQLIFDDGDKQVFLREAQMSFDWHKKAFSVMTNLFNPDVFIHDIYTPNQMLTSRWWMGPFMAGNDSAKQDVFWMYKQLDDMIGEMIKKAGANTLVVVSSDHGAIELNRSVSLNNYFASKGWLKFDINNKTGEPVIDWNNSKVIYLKMDNVYINPKGLNGSWTRASGEDYEALRNEVVQALYDLNDNGTKPVGSVVRWEDSDRFLDLPEDRVGDLVIANIPGYGWSEEMSADLRVFSEPLVTGYKQAVFPGEDEGMWTPFMIMGPGVKQGYELSRPIRHEDQLPTILELMGLSIPSYDTGAPVKEVFSGS